MAGLVVAVAMVGIVMALKLLVDIAIQGIARLVKWCGYI
jgi:hypothetical protein